jgi:hypothetical protein
MVPSSWKIAVATSFPVGKINRRKFDYGARLDLSDIMSNSRSKPPQKLYIKRADVDFSS